MKRILIIAIAALLSASCANSKIERQAEPLIRAYLLETISHPETYTPVKTEVVSKEGDEIVIRHDFRHRSRQMDLLERSYIFRLPKEMDIILDAHVAPEQ